MSNRLRLMAGIFGLAAVLALGCSKQSADATTEAKASTSHSTQEAPAPSDEAAAQLAQDDQAPADVSEASAAYSAMIDEVQNMQRNSSGTQQSMMELVGKMESMFKDFIKKYPGSVEAKDAKFQLGLIYSTLQRAQDAIIYLQDYIETSEGENPDKVGYAHFYLAEAFKGADRFDEAKIHYDTFLKDYPGANPQAIAQARMSLEDLEALRKLAVGADPIPFRVTGTEGQVIDLSEYKGKVVLLDFWATWCGPCRMTIPSLVETYKKYNDKGFEVIGISLDQNRTAFDRYIKQNGMTWDHYFDGRGWSNELAMKYKVRGIPAAFLIDREGKIRFRLTTATQSKALEKEIEALMKETS